MTAIHGPWELDLRDDPRLQALYLDNESHDGYHRDQDVFGPGVTTEDNLAVIVDYARGATLSYALQCPFALGGLPDRGQWRRGPSRARGGRTGSRADRRQRQVRGRPECGGRRVFIADWRRAADLATSLGGSPGRQDRRRRLEIMAEATRCCSPISSAAQEMTGWNDQPIGWTGSAPSRSGWQATSHCAPASRSRSPISASVLIFPV